MNIWYYIRTLKENIMETFITVILPIIFLVFYCIVKLSIKEYDDLLKKLEKELQEDVQRKKLLKR